ncbi:MAG: hypothetical protein KC621_27375 [Myxococcales bacterium]|nr:hypothetical protein [Myxococcales bacterium]
MADTWSAARTQFTADVESFGRLVGTREEPPDDLDDPRDNANHLFAVRTLSLLRAVALVDWSEIAPFGSLARSAFETTLTWRWVLSDQERGKEWGMKVAPQLVFIAKRARLAELQGEGAVHDLARGLDSVALERGETNLTVQRYADQVGERETYDRCYPLLSGMAHPNPISMRGTDMATKLAVALVVKRVLQEAANLYVTWAVRRELPPVLPPTPP